MALVSNILTQVFITLIAVAGVYVLTGLTGMFSLGQAAFMAIGSYASGLLVVKAHMPLVPAIIIAVALATLVGYLIGYPVVRLRRDYISLVTLGFGEAIAALLNRMTSLTGGASGFTGIPRKTTLTIAAVSAVLAIALVAFFKSSKYGRQCIALRGDELAAKAMGINVIRIKMTAFLLSVALTAYSGCLYAFYMSYVDPTGFGWKKSADWVIMVFFGGVNSLTGSTLGAFILSALPQVLRGLQNYRYVIYAVLVLLIINFKPSGLLGEWEFTPRDIARSARKLKRKLGLKKEEKTMKVIIGSARRDENGKYAGGKPGDQDGVEVSTQNYYVHTKGWYMFRFLSDEHAKKVAKAMWDACMNNNIGYCQAHRSIMAMLKKYGSMKAIGEKTETDCSDLVRGCIYEATGIDVGAFSTATEPSVLEKSGLFAKKVSVTSATVLKSGDILVTKSKGHTVIVVSVGGSAPSGSASTSKPAVSGSTAKVESARSKDAAIAGKYKTTSNLYLRVGAGTGKTAITLMPAGSSVQCYGYYTTYNGTRWYYVAYGDKTGFCSSAYLRKA